METDHFFENIAFRDAVFDNESELRMVAQLYVAVPLSWDSNFVYTKDTVQRNYQWLVDKKECLKCIIIISKSKIVGLHILLKEENSLDCFIKTLWLSPELRNQGLGSRLKEMGESWARQKGAKTIITHVMANNPKMLQMNRQKGFITTKFEMAKKL